MAFQVDEEAVSVMRGLARKIPDSVEGLLSANQDVLRCYEDVKDTVGPHTAEIEKIVHKLNRLIKHSSASINEVPERLEKLASRSEEIIKSRPSRCQDFRSSLRVESAPEISPSFLDNCDVGNYTDAFIGEEVRERGHETQFSMEVSINGEFENRGLSDDDTGANEIHVKFTGKLSDT